jgi:hypothetical protein
MSASTVIGQDEPSTRARRPFLEWFWRGRELEAARRARHESLTEIGARLRHALAAAELAARVLDGVDPLRAEPGHWLALSLYREAAYWALLAQDEAFAAGNLAEAFSEAPRELLLFAAGGEEALDEIRRLLLAESTGHAEDDVDVQTSHATLARGFVEALLRLPLRPTERVFRALLQRWSRTGGAIGLCIALVLVTAALVRSATRPPDLALEKPWRTSSSAGDCRPAQRSCLGARTGILFHTNTEKEPWFELDLGEPRAFSVIEVVNRDDCCPDVSLPLALEVSDDREQWREVARRKESFDTWRAELPPQHARYVRARALRKTALHLVRVSVFER